MTCVLFLRHASSEMSCLIVLVYVTILIFFIKASLFLLIKLTSDRGLGTELSTKIFLRDELLVFFITLLFLICSIVYDYVSVCCV